VAAARIAVNRSAARGLCSCATLSHASTTTDPGLAPYDRTGTALRHGPEGACRGGLEGIRARQGAGREDLRRSDRLRLSGDAFHITSPTEDGDGAYRCMTAAVKRAGISPSDIDYINAHGTSTPLGDEIELKAVERVVGNAAGKLAMSSTKSATGHLLGAAGAVEAIFSVLAIRDQVAPPTLNLDNPSVETAIDLVPHAAKAREIEVVLSNSFGFGGTNASLIFRRAA
jgi:3-oxoacyl-[acyl-carrier-protein] synthase II